MKPFELLHSAASTAVALPAAEIPSLPVPAANELNLLELVLHASLPVQLVMVLLLLGSVASWVIIFRKKKVLDDARRAADEFEERFWSGADLAALFRDVTGRDRRLGGLEAIFEGGFREFARLRQKRGVDTRIQLEGAQRAMRASLAREVDGLEYNLEFLANVGSISPYVGLFGTVWGIMISFQGLANVKEATIATVAPGHFRGADRHRDGPVRRDPGGVGLQPLPDQGRAHERALRDLCRGVLLDPAAPVAPGRTLSASSRATPPRAAPR
jgi:biopolymer transport protein TolQ